MASHSISRLPADLEMREGAEKKSIELDRRKRPRAQVHWPLSFSLSGTNEVVHTTTHDLSSDGFYCIANVIFVPGETRDCTLAVPTHHPDGEMAALPVHCRIRIIRVERMGESGFYGVGCQITDYRFVNTSAGHPALVEVPKTAEVQGSPSGLPERHR